MNKIFTLITLICLLSFTASAQIFRKADPVICPVDHNSYDTFVAPPAAFKNAQARSAKSTSTADIVVTYNGFTEEARIAYQYAVDIWASLLKSPTTIYVNANFADLGQGVLGSAGPSSFVRDFPGAPFDTTFYPLPLAEKLAGFSLNAPGDADIISNFSSTFDYYFGLDGNPPSGQYDFVSIVLHELGHGLGFTGAVSYNPTTGIGSWDIGTTNKSSIFTKFVETGDGTLITSLPPEGAETAEAFTNNDLFFNAPLSFIALGERPQLYAPSSWNSGSSYSHLDEIKYPAGNENSLMSPQFGAGEAIHDPGVSLDIFADMGWVHTYLNHINTNQITNNISDDFSVNLSVASDTGFNLLAPVLIYTTSDFSVADTISMTDTGNGINFEATIPNPGGNAVIKYYFSGVKDGLGRDFTSPFNAPANFYDINILTIPFKPVPYTLTDGGNFETNPNDFQSLALKGENNLWEYGEPGNKLNETFSGTKVWKTKLNEDIGKPNTSISSALISPIFDFSDDTKNHLLQFKFSMENAYTSANGVFDSGPLGFNVQFSLDKGQSWFLLGNKNDEAGTNWYNVKENSPSVFPPDMNAGWIEQTIEIVDGDTLFIPKNVSYNVSKLAGNPNVTFRLVMYVTQDFIDAGYNADGVLVDDFEILTSNPTAEFTATSSDLVYPGDEISFDYLSTGATSYLWDFGDGNTSNLENPTHIYTEGGYYNVSLTITSSNGEVTLLKENYIRVIPTRQIPYLLADGGDLEGEQTDFSIVNVSGTGFELGQSSVSGKSGTSSGANAFVTDIDTDLYENDSEAYIYTPEFDFSSLGTYEFSFHTNYQFEDNWDGFIVEYTMDRGENWIKLNNEIDEDNWYNQISDAQSVFGNEVPIFSGNTGGQFLKKAADVSFLGGTGIVSFRIKFLTDPAEVDAGMAIDDFEITGPAPGPLVPYFEADVTSGCEGLVVTFTNLSEGSAKALEWDFGAGAIPATATGNGPHEVIYPDAGNYTVTMTAEDFIGVFRTEERIDYISIGPIHEPTITTGERNNEFTRLLTASEGDAYQWFLESDSIIGATEQTYLATEDGRYTVAVNIDGCTGYSLTENIITANDSPLNRSLIIFPNPVNENNHLKISFKNDYMGSYEVTVYNVTGGIISKQSFHKNEAKEEAEISLNNIGKGLYMINISAGSSSTQRKIIIE